MRLIVTAALALCSVAAPARADGVDFIDDAKLLYRIAACGGSEPVADNLTKIVERHCKLISERLDKFRAEYFVKHREWFTSVVPKDVPKTVVYPFGGGDLISALVAFPDAIEITTVSLDQPDLVKPTREIWLSERIGWTPLGPALDHYPRESPNSAP